MTTCKHHACIYFIAQNVLHKNNLYLPLGVMTITYFIFFTFIAFGVFKSMLQVLFLYPQGRLAHEKIISSSYYSAFGHPGTTFDTGGIGWREHVTIFLQLDPSATPALHTNNLQSSKKIFVTLRITKITL